MNLTAKQHAAKLLDRLRGIDDKTSAAYYEMGQLLAALDHSSMYAELGYTSTSAMIEEELSFTPSTGVRYMSTYRHLKRLNYNKAESLQLIRKHSFTHVSNILPGIKTKVSNRKISAAVKKDRESSCQINFALSPEDLKKLENLLMAYGAKRAGTRLLNASDALTQVVDEFDVSEAA